MPIQYTREQLATKINEVLFNNTSRQIEASEVNELLQAIIYSVLVKTTDGVKLENILANGNSTGTNDISLEDNQAIKGGSGIQFKFVQDALIGVLLAKISEVEAFGFMIDEAQKRVSLVGEHSELGDSYAEISVKEEDFFKAILTASNPATSEASTIAVAPAEISSNVGDGSHNTQFIQSLSDFIYSDQIGELLKLSRAGSEFLADIAFSQRVKMSKLKLTATPVFASNAAALSGGLAVGEVYRDSSGKLFEVI